MFDRMVNQFFDPVTPAGVRVRPARMPYRDRLKIYGPKIAVLRLEGKSFADIAKTLGIPKTMANNTLSEWVEEVKNETL